MVKLQCDFSAMISPGLFSDFMKPVLVEMTERTAHNMYHLDGPEALIHLPCLLSIPDLEMIQWTPGAGQPFVDEPVWFPMYRQVLEAGKKLFMYATSLDHLKRLHREFGDGCRQMLINMYFEDPAEVDEAWRILES